MTDVDTPPPAAPSGPPPASPRDERPELAQALPNYEIGSELGRGGMGVVLEGRQTSLDRPVAIKELPTGLATTREVRERFRSEAQLLARMDHGHIVPVYDFVENDDLCLLVMEHLPGGTVWGRFTEQGLTYEASVAIALATCEALQYAHDRQVLHRDVKPENVMFSGDGTVKVTDFGIAEMLGGDELLATTSGEVVGTPAYIAPEQASGEALGPPADVFATGVMLYELLSGRLPYSEEGGPLAVLFRHAQEDHVPIETVAPQVPQVIADVVATALQRDPADRYQTAEEFGIALGSAAALVWGPTWLDGFGSTVRISGPIAAAARGATADATATGSAPVMPSEPAVSQSEPGGDSRSTTAAGGPPTPPGAPADGDSRSTMASGGPPSPPAPPTSSTPGDTGDSRSTMAAGGPPAAPPGPPPTVAGRPLAPADPPPPTPGSGSGPVKPSEESKAANGPARRIDPDKLVPVRDLLEPPPPPTAWRLGALGLVVLTILLAAVGGPSPSSSDGDAVAGQVTADGVEVITDDRLELGFGGPVVIGVSDELVEAGATEVEVTVAVSGITLPAGRTEPIEPAEDADDVERFGFANLAEIDSPLLGFLVGGPAEVTVDVLDADGTTLVSPTAAFEPERGGAVTVPNVLAIIVLLIVVVYTESFIRPMRRRGNRRLGSTIGLGVVGFLFGVSASVLGWTLLGAPLHLAWSILVGLVGAAALVVLGVSSAKRARRKRVEFIIEQQQLAQFLDRAA